MEDDGTITRQVKLLRKVIEESSDKLRALGKEREKRKRKVALHEAYPSPLKKPAGE